MRKFILYSFLYLLVQACSGIQLINQADFYSEEFLKKIESIQLIYKDGDKKLALTKLRNILDEKITSAEKAKKYNLVGVIHYAGGDTTQAIENFQLATQFVDKDLILANQIKLNLASSYFRNEKYESTQKQLKKIDINYLSKKEVENFHRLNFTVASQMEDYSSAVKSLLYLTKNIDTFSKFEDFKYKEVLIDNFKKLNSSERVYILDEFLRETPVVIAYLGKQEAMDRFYVGDRQGSKDVVSWLDDKFGHLEEIKTFVTDYNFRVDNYSKINSGAIGVVAPLSGKVSKYGLKVLAGINTALLQKDDKKSLIKVFVKDNNNNTYLAKKMVQELVMKHHVSVIIGGLFPSLAKEEYLEARKYGVMYVSMSPVYLPRSEKNHLLLEVSGSVESQINTLIKPEVLNKLGSRMAILYPKSDDGNSYVNEFWNLNMVNKLQLNSVYNFDRGITDYREPVKEILGLRYPREREEEFKIWKDIKNIDKNNVRIINVLPPIIEFDWIFIPSLPSEALQIIPTFSYFDAKKVKFIGGPSWINNTLKENKKNLGSMYVIGNDTSDTGTEFMKIYKKHNGSNPHLVDTLSYESMDLILKIVDKSTFTKREDMEERLRSLKTIKGVTSSWTLDNGLWIKEMDLLSIKSSGFEKMSFTE